MAAPRPALLSLLVGAATLSAMMSAMSIASPAPAGKGASANAPASRMGAGISDDIAARDAREAEQARALDLKEQAIRAAQARLAASVKAKAQATPQTTPANAPNAAAAPAPDTPDQFDTLARIYQAMKPAKAAPVFSRLDLDVQYMVARRMRERSTAMILAAMEPAAAARLSMALAGKRPGLRRGER